jgi:hypothetical protein
LTFTLDAGAPAGATVHPTTGGFTFTPTTAGTFPVTVRVTDNGAPALDDFETILIAVDQGNSAPTADAGGPYTVLDGGSVVLSGSASDPDPGDILTYEWDLDGDGNYGEPA